MSEADKNDPKSPIDELSGGYEVFRTEIDKHPLARKMAEVAIITFGGSVNLMQPFVEARYLPERRFTADGATPMGAAINLGIDELTQRKSQYKTQGLSYVRPWFVVISDGAPTDDPEYFAQAAQRLKDYEEKKGVSVFAIGVGPFADLNALSKLGHRPPKLIRKPAAFQEFFAWLCAAMIAGSTSKEGEQLF